MKSYMSFFTACGLLVLAGCATTRMTASNTKMSFEYEGDSYTIQSHNPDTQVGYNILVSMQDEKTVFKALDEQQDGVIDKVVVGDIPMWKAQTIYDAGIKSGREKGAVKKRYVERTYTCSDANYYYVLQTFELAVGDVYNKLVIQDRSTSFFQTIVTDIDADGSLNRIDKDGKLSMDAYQDFYKTVIARGMSEGKIQKSDNKYLVAMR
ncbi:hypothetical protein JXO52_02810 [bacterium]|nr:hypothetical protein [bacterium]